MTILDELFKQARQEIADAVDLKALDDCRVIWLGKKGKITEQLKTLGQLSAAERPQAGQQINQLKEKVQQLIEDRVTILNQQKIAAQLAADSLDISLPGRRHMLGTLHPVTLTRQRIENHFIKKGFDVMEGPEIEDDYHNFSALNIPLFHPARAMQDTFYFADGTLLRTHMSPVQIRAMKQGVLPLRMIAMGRVYRRDFDLTHTPMFHQIEGMLIDKIENVSLANLKSVLTEFLEAFFAKKVSVRFRASYFPFTEPSAEVDIGCLQCDAVGCRICKQTGWLEVLGCGMIHPEVLRMAGIDDHHYAGWAFGAGLDRLSMLRYGITDLRLLFENNLRFLQQFMDYSV